MGIQWKQTSHHQISYTCFIQWIGITPIITLTTILIIAIYIYIYLTRLAVNTGWWEIDIHGYSLVKIAFGPICARKNNRRIWRHNASTPRSRNITDQLRWRHDAKSVKTALSDNGELGDRKLLLAEFCIRDIREHVRNKIIPSLPRITILWSLVRLFAIGKSHQLWPKIVIHGNTCIILYITIYVFDSVICRIVQ